LTFGSSKGYVDVAADASALPFRDESFDVVISTETLEHVEDCDFKAIFSDMAILKLIEDPQAPGVLFAGVKIRGGHATSRIPVYSMALNREL